MTTETDQSNLDARIAQIVSRLLREERADAWLSSAEAAAHLRMSKHHFLRLCRQGDGPQCSGEGRLKRWRRSVLDAWQQESHAGVRGYLADPRAKRLEQSSSVNYNPRREGG